jgi:hypothetical protein
MSRFNVRAITEAAPAPLPAPIQNKQPSAYAAMNKKGAGSAPSISSSTGNVVIEPKKGRPTKDDLRRQKMDLADAAIIALVSHKPTKAKIREYFEGRIAVLNAEKR